jgi:uncharacterized protein
MKLRVHEIQDAEIWESITTLPLEEVVLDTGDHPRLVRPVDLVLHATADKEEVTLWAEVAARVRLDCARCLEGFETDLKGSFEMRASVDDTFIEISDEVRQALLLALPAKPLCRDDCRGICPGCGRNRNKTAACACAGADAPAGTPFAKLKDFKKR